MDLPIIIPLVWLMLFPAAVSPWVLEEIKPLNLEPSITKKSDIPVSSAIPTQSTDKIKQDIQDSILGSKSTKEPSRKLKEGVKKLLDFLEAGSSNNMQSNTTKENSSTTGSVINETATEKFGGLEINVTMVTNSSKNTGNDVTNMTSRRIGQDPNLNTVNGTSGPNFGQNTQLQNSPVRGNPVRGQVPYATVTNVAAVAPQARQMSPYTGYSSVYQRSGIPVANAYNGYSPYGYHGYQALQSPVHAQFQRPLAYAQRQRIPNFAYQRPQMHNYAGLSSPMQTPYQRMYARTQVTRPYRYGQPLKPVSNQFITRRAQIPYTGRRYGNAWALASRRMNVNRARVPNLQRSRVPVRMPARENIPYYIPRKTGFKFGAGDAGYKFKRVAINKRKLPYNGIASTRATVGRKTMLPLPLASIMTAARIVVPVQPQVQSGVSTVEMNRPSYSEERGAGAV